MSDPVASISPPSASPRSGETSRLAVSDAGRIRPPAVSRLNSQTPRLPAAKAIPVPMSSSAKSPVKRPFRGVCPSPRSFRTRDPPMPRRVSSAQVSSAESCWLHDVRTLATRDLSNETSRERFTCVVAYSFVWRDSRTSVTLCTPHRPNCMLTSLQCRLLSFCYPSRVLLGVRVPLTTPLPTCCFRCVEFRSLGVW